jgi:hypothetical protein
VILAGVASVPTDLLVLYAYRSKLDTLTKAPEWIVLALVLVIASSVLWLGRGRFLAFLGLRHFSTHPPIWLGGVVGTSLVWVLLARVPQLQRSFELPLPSLPWLDVLGLAGLSGTALLATGSVMLAADRARRRGDLPRLLALGARQPPQLTSFDAFRKWLSDDTPVESADHDAFDYQRIAHRIAARLLIEKPPAQAVVGALGAGKTTLRKLVAAALAAASPPCRVHVVPVELWPFETSRAAVQGVIGALVDALAREVSVVGLRGLPGEYAEAMSATGSIGAALVRIQGIPSSPLAALRRIDEIATAIGIRYVVWVEDLERFAGGHSSTAVSVETSEEAERLAPIRALLGGLDQLHAITVITATTTLDKRFDLEKIARYVETLPDLKEEHVTSALEMFRTGCLRAYEVIDPFESLASTRSSGAVKKRRDLIKFTDPAGITLRRAMLGSRPSGIGEAIAALVRTPRTMKQGLRACLETWDCLPGEVDFDDVLVMSLLRVALPDVFSLVERHVGTLRREIGYSDEDGKTADEAWSRDLSAAVADARTRQIVAEVIKFVFAAQGKSAKPQGLATHAHADYWRRFLDVPALVDAERDQTTLRVIFGNDDGALLSLVMDAKRSAAVEDFSGLLSVDRIRGLFAPLIKRLVPIAPASWDENPPGLIPTWRMWLACTRRGEIDARTVLQSVKDAYDVSIRSNLGLVDEIEHWFVTGKGGETDFFVQAPPEREEAMRYLRRLVLEIHAGHPETLATALRGAKPAVLLRICWGLDRVRASDYAGVPFEGWEAFASTVLDATKAHPEELLPQLACLVMRESTVVRDNIVHKYEFDSEVAARLFGKADVVLDLFTLGARSK